MTVGKLKACLKYISALSLVLCGSFSFATGYCQFWKVEIMNKTQDTLYYQGWSPNNKTGEGQSAHRKSIPVGESNTYQFFGYDSTPPCSNGPNLLIRFGNKDGSKSVAISTAMASCCESDPSWAGLSTPMLDGLTAIPLNPTIPASIDNPGHLIIVISDQKSGPVV